MLCGLFSSFDPSTELVYFPSKWVMMGVLVIFLDWRIFTLLVGLNLFLKKSISFFLEVFSQSMSKCRNVVLMLYSVFFFFLLLNLIGLFPFQFSFTAHLSVNLSISLTAWMCGILTSIQVSFTKFIAHLVPVGSPEFLWPLLVVVESISMVIRPITLAVRLMANILAGHLIMTLISSFSTVLMVLPFFPILGIVVFFLMFEFCVSAVQAYVFVNLLSLYWAEAQ